MLNINIVQLDCRQDHAEHPDCVQTVHYSISKTDGEYSASTYGTVSLQEPAEGHQYILFPNLTKEQVIEWCAFDTEAIEATLDSEINRQKNPPVVGKNPPWGE